MWELTNVQLGQYWALYDNCRCNGRIWRTRTLTHALMWRGAFRAAPTFTVLLCFRNITTGLWFPSRIEGSITKRFTPFCFANTIVTNSGPRTRLENSRECAAPPLTEDWIHNQRRPQRSFIQLFLHWSLPGFEQTHNFRPRGLEICGFKVHVRSEGS